MLGQKNVNIPFFGFEALSVEENDAHWHSCGPWRV